MGKNTFQSLAIAASMLGMSANSATAQGSGDQIAETKGAIEALISSLPSEQFKAAITVLEGDKALLADGFLDGKDATTIRDHASKLLGISKDAAQKVLDSLNQSGVIANTVQAGVKPEVKKSEPKIGETPAEKKERLEKERLEKLAVDLVKECNKEVMKADKWSSLKTGAAGNDAEVTIKNSNGGLKFSIEKSKTLGQAVIHKDLLPGKYKVELTSTAGNIIIWWKGGKEIILSNGDLNTFELPQNTKIDICVKPDRLNPSIEVTKFVLSQEEDQKIAGK